eukprot:3800430-Pleurochrysis_carterae.AAC.1
MTSVLIDPPHLDIHLLLLEEHLRSGNLPTVFIAHPDSVRTFAMHNSKHTRIDALLQLATSSLKEQYSAHMITTIGADIEWNDVKNHYAPLLRRTQTTAPSPQAPNHDETQQEAPTDGPDAEDNHRYTSLIQTESDFARYAAFALLQLRYGIITYEQALLRVLEVFFRLDPAIPSDAIRIYTQYDHVGVNIRNSAHLLHPFRRLMFRTKGENAYLIGLSVAYQIMATYALRMNSVFLLQALCNQRWWNEIESSMCMLFFKNLAMADTQTLEWFQTLQYEWRHTSILVWRSFYRDEHFIAVKYHLWRAPHENIPAFIKC